MKKSCQIAVSTLATLIAASPFNCPSAATVTVTYESEFSTSASSFVSVTSASYSVSTAIIDDSDDYMTISITNVYETQLSLFFASNADDSAPVENSSAIILFDISPIQYTFPTEWAERIYVELNTNSMGSKIEGSLTDSSNINVSYVDDYSVLITCFFEGTAIFDCNIDLFKQSGITCNNQVDDSVCLNFAQNIVNEFASPFFTACAEAVYTYSKDDKINVSNLKSNLISCCIDMSCEALSRQLHKRENSTREQSLQIRNAESEFEKIRVFSSSLHSFARKLRHYQHSSRSRVHE